jgi:hypothetical protein
MNHDEPHWPMGKIWKKWLITLLISLALRLDLVNLCQFHLRFPW